MVQNEENICAKLVQCVIHLKCISYIIWQISSIHNLVYKRGKECRYKNCHQSIVAWILHRVFGRITNIQSNFWYLNQYIYHNDLLMTNFITTIFFSFVNKSTDGELLSFGIHCTLHMRRTQAQIQLLRRSHGSILSKKHCLEQI